MRPPLYHLMFACAFALHLFAVAQTGTVRGFVYEEASGEPSIFTPVTLLGASVGTTTDMQGYFCLSKLPPGMYTLRIVYLGFDTLTKVVEVTADQIETVKCFLKRMANAPQYVRVDHSTPERPIRAYHLSPKDIERVVPIGSVDDEIRSSPELDRGEPGRATSSLTLFDAGIAPPNIAFLLSLTDCLDSACVSVRARAINYHFMGGSLEDGWNWFSCDYSRADSISDFDRLVTLGFFGYSWSNYRDYTIVTGDTTAAETLTKELLRLGFKVKGELREGQLYQSNAYPGLELQRLEKRHHSVMHREKQEPPHPRALTKEEAGREQWGDVVTAMKGSGFDSFDIIPHLIWVFKVRVHTPR